MLPSGELLVLNAVLPDAFSRYECRVTHRLSGETRLSSGSPGRVSVSEPLGLQAPRFSERSVSVEARRDELVVVPCVATGHPPPEYR